MGTLVASEVWFYPGSGEHFQVISMVYVFGTVVPLSYSCMLIPHAVGLRSTIESRELAEVRKGAAHRAVRPPLSLPSTGSVPVSLTCC